MQQKRPLFVLTALLLLPFAAFSAPKLELSVRAEIETTVDVDGKPVIQRIAAAEVEPGQEVIYTISYSNKGDESAANVVLNDKVPKHASYVAGSAWGTNADILFSIDNGTNFKQPSLLVYQIKNEQGDNEERKASPEKYSHVRWVIKEVPANSKGEVGYRVTVN